MSRCRDTIPRPPQRSTFLSHTFCLFTSAFSVSFPVARASRPCPHFTGLLARLCMGETPMLRNPLALSRLPGLSRLTRFAASPFHCPAGQRTRCGGHAQLNDHMPAAVYRPSVPQAQGSTDDSYFLWSHKPRLYQSQLPACHSVSVDERRERYFSLSQTSMASRSVSKAISIPRLRHILAFTLR